MKAIEIDVLKFISPISIDNGYTNTYQGKFESEMILYKTEKGYFIVWDNPVDVGVMNIEYYIEEGRKIVTGYDGVIDFPPQVIQLLERNDFNCDKINNNRLYRE